MKAKAMKIPFDTLAYIQTLRKSGIDEGCANAHAQALVMAFTQGVATHEDIEEMDARMCAEFANVRSEMFQEFTKVRAEMDQGFTKTRVLVIATLILVALTNPVALHVLHITGLLH
jgi:hypothetical protein